VELQGRVKELQDQGVGLAAISYDSREVMTAFAAQHGITFPLLADPGSETIKRYGILNTVVAEALGPNGDDPSVRADVQKYISVAKPSPNHLGMAFPGTFMLDRRGRVTARFFEDLYVERNTVSSVLKTLGVGGGAVAGRKISTEHLELTTYPSDATIAAGNRFSVVLDIVPKRGMHVYAPGASTYRVVSVAITEPPFVRRLALTYPSSEIYHFRPLNERVPVYQKPFTLVLELVLEGDPKAQAAYRGKESLTIAGTFEYQACDDRICYNPVSLPLSWTVRLRPLVIQRPAVAK
jgi:peroxiredoxin